MSTSADELTTDNTPEPPTKLTVFADGPIELKGDFELIGRDGETLIPGRKTAYLCRCGRSANKPFCDGGHKDAGFTDAVVS